MEYMEALLQKQTKIAAELETEPEAARALWHAVLRMRAAQADGAEARDARQTLHGAMERGDADGAGKVQTEDDAEQALGKLTELDAERARVRRLSESGAQSGGAAFSAHTAAHTAAARAAEATPFFTEDQSEAPRALSGTTDARTQRSMQEISRFFERDARRYGG